jgi:ribosome-associated toxin RatA of RatAB toxin-antitoxin module
MSTNLPVPLDLGPMPVDRRMTTVDERVVRAPAARIFALAADVERWPALLPHYRYVRFQERRADGGGIVEMSAYRPFGLVRWPTWWRSTMRVRRPGGTDAPSIRFTHVGGITRGMEVEWTFHELDALRTLVRILHVWDGPDLPVVGPAAATLVIGPVFVHGIASRTLAGLAEAAERAAS